MPYSGVTPGSETEQKIDRCVEEVMGRDSSMDKSGAIAICRSSIENKEMDDVEKFMYGSGNAISFAELDAVRMAHEQAEALMKLTMDFQNITDNIMWSPDVKDKGAAVRQLASEFADRLDTGNYKELTLFKEVWTAAYVNDLPDSAFLFIESGGSKSGGKTEPKSLRHLPYKDKNGSVDLPHLRNAISRLGQSATGKGWKGFSRESTLKKAQGILASASPKKETRLNKFVSAIKGLVTKSEPEIQDDANGFLVWKDKGGTYRWIARYSNNLRDDDNPPEIISSKSHQRFEALVDAGVVPAPELWLWHNKDWKIGQSEWVAYDDEGFAMAGGYIFPECEAIAKQLQTVGDAGVSHGMKGEFIRRDASDPSVIVQHITHEISPLPLWAAANKRTGFVVLDDVEDDKEINMLSKDKRQELINKWGFSEDYLAALERLNKEDSDNAVGVERKEMSAETETAETAPVETQAPAPDTAVADAELVEDTPVADETPVTSTEEPAAADPELLNAVEETMKAVMTLTKELRELAAEVQEVKKSEEKKIADMVKQSPLASLTHMMVNSVIGSEATRVDGRTTLAKDGPQETAPLERSITGIPLVDRMITNADRKSA